MLLLSWLSLILLNWEIALFNWSIELDEFSITAYCGVTNCLSETAKNSLSNSACSALACSTKVSCSAFLASNSLNDFWVSSFIFTSSSFFASKLSIFWLRESCFSSSSLTIFLSMFTNLLVDSILDIKSLKLSALNNNIM